MTTPTLTTLPIPPRDGTQAARLLAELRAGRSVDPFRGWFRLGIYRLSDTVLQLRKAGWGVVTDTKEVKNRHGEVCRVANYRLLLSREHEAQGYGDGSHQGVA